MSKKNSRNNKKPSQNTYPSKAKIPKSGVVKPVHQQKPQWDLSIFDFKSEWGFPAIRKNADLAELYDKLCSYSSMTWGEIESKARGNHAQNHIMSVDKIAKRAQKRLKDIEQEDVDEVYSMTITGKKRLWGIRSGPTLKLLWIDNDHKIYKTEKRYT